MVIKFFALFTLICVVKSAGFNEEIYRLENFKSKEVSFYHFL